MKAIRVKEFGGPEKLLLEEVPDPKPGPGQVVVKIDAAGVNPVDVYMRAGTYARKPPLPYTPGTDGAGTILSVGEGVDSVAPGARVYTAGSLSGTYAEQALCEAWAVFPLPANAWFSQGASMHVPYATAYRALFQKAKALPAETVLIQGASGGVGIAAVQLARAAGLHVVGTASTERGRKLVADEGAHEVLDHSAPDHFEKALALTKGRGYDVIIEMLANVNLAKDLPDSRDGWPRERRRKSRQYRNQSARRDGPRRLNRLHVALERFPEGSHQHPLSTRRRPRK